MKQQKIYIIMVIEDITDKPEPYGGFIGDTRIVGWYSDKDTAFKMVKVNNADIYEYLYNYALIEEVEEGLYQPATKESRWLFKYNKEQDTYEECKEPDTWKHACGLTIG